MDDFKEYLKNNASGLDLDEPSEAIWVNIRKETKRNKGMITIPLFRYGIAASVVILLMFGIWIIFINKGTTVNSVVQYNKIKKVIPETQSIKTDGEKEESSEGGTTVQQNLAVNQRSKAKLKSKAEEPRVITATEGPNSVEMHSLDVNFIQVINLEKERINKTPLYTAQPGYFNYFILEFRRIEKDEAALEKEIRSSGINDDLLTQLIAIYQQKLNILKSLQSEINKTNTLFKENRPVSEGNQQTFLNI